MNNFSTPQGKGAQVKQQGNYTSKRYPAFGKQLNQLRRKGLTPSLRVVVSTSWDLGAAYPRIVIPDDIPIVNLNFSYLAGLSVQIVHCNGATSINDLIDEILKVKPKELIVCNYDLAKNNHSGNSAYTLIQDESVEVPHGT